VNLNFARMVAEPKGQPQATPAGGSEPTNGEGGPAHSFATALQAAHQSNSKESTPKDRKDPRGGPAFYPALDAQLAGQVSAMQPATPAPPPPPPSFSIALQPPTNGAASSPDASDGGGASSSTNDAGTALDAASQAGRAVVTDFAMLAGIPAVPEATVEPEPALTAATGVSQPSLPSAPPLDGNSVSLQTSISPAKLDPASKIRPSASSVPETAYSLSTERRTPNAPNARFDAPSPRVETPSPRNETPRSPSPSPSPSSSSFSFSSPRAENRPPTSPSSSSAAAPERVAAKNGARTSSDDDTTPSAPSAAAAPGPVALEAIHSLPHVTDNANVVTTVNDSSPETKATNPDSVASTDAAVSAANQAVIRRTAEGEIHIPELGRIAVRAEGTTAAVNVDVSVDRADTHAVLHASAGALAADLRQADVPLGHLRFDRGGAHGAPGDSGTGYGTPSHDTPRDSHSSADHDEADDTTPTAAAGRVRIVL